MAKEWPLLGRGEELDFVAGALRAGLGGLVLAGTAGAGKTRLAAEAVSLANEEEMTAEWVRATPATTPIPFGAFSRLIAGVDPSSDLGRDDMFRRATEVLMQRSAGTRLFLVVDDAHLLDDLSAALLHQVAGHPSVFLLLTVRTGEPTPDPISSLWKDGLLSRLEVLPLSQAETASLVREALGGQVDESSLASFWTTSGGNPLFLREIVLDATDSGRLRNEGGVWRLRGGTTTSRLRDLVNHRLGSLTEDERSILETVALCEPTGVGLLGEFDRVAPVLASLERRGLIETAADGRRVTVRLGHPVYGEVVRALVTPLARRLHLRQLAQAMEACGARRPDDLLRLATWQVDAGAVSRPDLLVPAARQLNALYDYARAEQVARAAAEHTADVDASIVLATALNGQGRHRDADVVLAGATPSATTDEQRARIADARLYALFNGLGLVEEAIEMLEATRATLTEPRWRDYVEASRCSTLEASGDVTATLAAADPLLRREGVDEEVRLRILPAAGVALVLAGASAEALDLADRTMESAVRLAPTLPRGVGWAFSVRLLALMAEGRLDECEQLLEILYPVAAQQEADDQRGGICLLRGRVALGRGDAATALRWLREAEGLLVGRDYDSYLPWCRALLAQALAAEDQMGEAEQALESAHQARGVVRTYDADIDMAEAHVSFAQGRVSEAVKTARSVAERARRLGQAFPEAWILHELVRWGVPSEAIDALDALDRTVVNPWIQAFAVHARAAMAGEGPGLEAASESLARLGGWLMASEASSEAAAAFDREGLRARAAACRKHAHDLAARSGRVPTEPTADIALSRREREVARLAARGLSNKEIADQLVLSTRTVESHLYQAFAKLGVSSRAELAGVLI